MGDQPDFGNVFGESVFPLPGAESSDPLVNRRASDIENFEFLHRQLQDSRGTNKHNDLSYRYEQIGTRIGQTATDERHLLNSIRRELYGRNHSYNRKNAESVIHAATVAFQKKMGIKDKDYVFYITLGLQSEFEKKSLETRRKRVDQIATQLESNPRYLRRLQEENSEGLRRNKAQLEAMLDQMAWTNRVKQIVQETSLDYEYVEQFLFEYDRLSQPKFPGKIDPRGVVGIQVTAPRVVTADILKDFIPVVGPGIGVYEAYTGRELLSNRELSNWERGLRIAIVLLPYAGRITRPVTRGALRYGGRLAKSLVRKSSLFTGKVFELVTNPAKEMARLAMDIRVSPQAMLRLSGRLRRMSLQELKQLHMKIRKAQKARIASAAKQSFQFTDDELRLMRELDETFQEFEGTVQSVQNPKTPPVRGFIFLSRIQPLILGRLLGRLLTNPRSTVVRSSLRAAEEIATNLRSRIAAHWNNAITGAGENATQAAQRVFTELKRINPNNPNKWVRKRLYDLWRKRALGRIYRDKVLRDELKEQAGIIVGRNPKTRNYTLHIRTNTRGRGRTQTSIDFDHAQIGHAQAVKKALETGDYRHLISTVSADNLQLMLGKENRNVIEEIRKAIRKFEGEE